MPTMRAPHEDFLDYKFARSELLRSTERTDTPGAVQQERRAQPGQTMKKSKRQSFKYIRKDSSGNKIQTAWGERARVSSNLNVYLQNESAREKRNESCSPSNSI